MVTADMSVNWLIIGLGQGLLPDYLNTVCLMVAIFLRPYFVNTSRDWLQPLASHERNMPDGLTRELIENPIVFRALEYIWDEKHMVRQQAIYRCFREIERWFMCLSW